MRRGPRLPRDPESLIISATKGLAGTCATGPRTGKEVGPRIHKVFDGPQSGRFPLSRLVLRVRNERKDGTSESLMRVYRGAGTGGERIVRERRREVFRGGRARPLLGCQPREPQQVRRGIH